MDDIFRVRSEKVFGSLASSASSSLQGKSSPWSVAGREVERQEWRRGKDADDASDRDQTPCSSSFLEEEWGIKASIGMDPTLDHEEEEDEHDKVAEGTEGVGDRLYMGEVSRHGSYLNSHNVLHGGSKDRRANSLAAKLRLKEDDAEARKLDSTPAASASASASGSRVKEQVVKSPGDGGRPKSILKRKGDTSVVKAKKRVRFDPSCLTHCEESSDIVGNFDVDSSNVNRMVSDKRLVLAAPRCRNASKVPDYLVNPSKYACYSSNTTTKVDEFSNTWASMDYLSEAKGSNSESRSEMEDVSVQLPKSVTFVPKKKRGDCNAVNDRNDTKREKKDDSKQSSNRAIFLVSIAAVEVQSEVRAVEEKGSEPNAVNDGNNTKQDEKDDGKQSLNRASFPVSIAAVEVQGEVCAVEEEGSEPTAVESSSHRKNPGRKYRSKSMSDESDSS